MKHRRRLTLMLLGLAVYAVIEFGPELLRRARPVAGGGDGDAAVEQAFDSKQSGRVYEVAGVVDRELADDREGSRHQRFIVRLESGQTLLIAHNIDLARRVPLAVGDRVEIRGEYEWTERGGLLHWTHHDPRGRRPGGWIRHRGETYR